MGGCSRAAEGGRAKGGRSERCDASPVVRWAEVGERERPSEHESWRRDQVRRQQGVTAERETNLLKAEDGWGEPGRQEEEVTY
jgi:hypothetical protein